MEIHKWPWREAGSHPLSVKRRHSMNSRQALKLLSLAFALLIALSSLTFPAQARPKVALVLGGGAARGISHIGLLKAFEENGIPVDIVVGTSMGSIVGGLYAAGYSPAEIEFLVRNTDFAELFSLSFPPRGGFVSTRRFEAFLDSLLDGKRFEDFRLPFYAVITDLADGEELALHEGPAARGIVASMSMPAVFPPVEIDGKYFVDGGMKNAVPVNVARQAGADVVIGVDITKKLEEVDYDNILNNLQLTLYFMIDGYVKQNESQADLIVVPGVQYDSYMAFSSVDYFLKKGYEAANGAMPRIRQILAAKDPGFEYTPIPKRATGATTNSVSLKKADTASLQKKVARAYARAAAVSPDFSIYPILEPELGTRTRLSAGIGLGGGKMGPWTASYDYQWEFARPEASHHTAALAYNFGKKFKAETYFKQFTSGSAIRPARQLAAQAGLGLTFRGNANWRLQGNYEVPVGTTSGAAETYTSERVDTPLWQVSAGKQQVLRWPWAAEFDLRAGRQRFSDLFVTPPAGISEETYSTGTAGFARSTLGLTYSLSERGLPFWETGIAYPYLLVQAGAVAFEAEANGANGIDSVDPAAKAVSGGMRQMELGAGAGVDIKLFGLYPFKARLLAETVPGAGQWSWSLHLGN